MATVDQVIAALVRLRDMGHGRKQIVLHDTNVRSTIEISNIEVFSENGKEKPTIFYEYGDLE